LVQELFDALTSHDSYSEGTIGALDFFGAEETGQMAHKSGCREGPGLATTPSQRMTVVVGPAPSLVWRTPSIATLVQRFRATIENTTR
jgi:hypothetical protein